MCVSIGFRRFFTGARDCRNLSRPDSLFSPRRNSAPVSRCGEVQGRPAAVRDLDRLPLLLGQLAPGKLLGADARSFRRRSAAFFPLPVVCLVVAMSGEEGARRGLLNNDCGLLEGSVEEVM